MSEVPLYSRLVGDGPTSERLMGPPREWIFDTVEEHRGTSLIRNRNLLGPYSRTMPGPDDGPKRGGGCL